MGNEQNGGIIERKKGFTMVDNSIARNPNLSLAAKGLFALIQSWSTYDVENFLLTKDFIKKQTQEGEKAFERRWSELKHAGLLITHTYPNNGKWINKHILENQMPLAFDGVYQYYHDSDGNVTNTNLTVHRIPQNGSTANGTIADGTIADGSTGNRGNSNKTINKTKDKTIFNKTNKTSSNSNNCECEKEVLISPHVAASASVPLDYYNASPEVHAYWGNSVSDVRNKVHALADYSRMTQIGLLDDSTAPELQKAYLDAYKRICDTIVCLITNPWQGSDVQMQCAVRLQTIASADDCALYNLIFECAERYVARQNDTAQEPIKKETIYLRNLCANRIIAYDLNAYEYI